MKNKIIILMIAIVITMSACSTQTDTEKIADIDLTEMSSTMVYSQVYDMMMNPSNYAGMSIKVVGTFYSEYYESTDTTYNFVIINDATGCCPQGIEFVSKTDEEMPEQGAEISMIGVFDIYDEGENQYYRITTDELL